MTRARHSYYNQSDLILMSLKLESWITLSVFIIIWILLALLVAYFDKSKHLRTFPTIFNILQSIFGFKIFQLPRKSLLSLTIMGFILMCLFIRTAFHGTLFGFTSQRLNKPEMSYEDFRDGNYTVFASLHRVDESEMIYIKNVTG